MLTEIADEDRQWRDFPEIRKILKNRSTPSDYYGPTSVSDNIFRRLERLAKTLTIVKEGQSAIEESTNLKNIQKVEEDLRHLASAAIWGADFFAEQASIFSSFARDIRQQFRKALSVPVGIAYNLILKHRVYSCPIAYNYEPTRLLAPRTSEGTIKNVFTIRKTTAGSLDGLDQTQLTEGELSRILGYISEAQPMGLLSETGEFRFYLLEVEVVELAKPFCPAQRLEGAHYIEINQLLPAGLIISEATL